MLKVNLLFFELYINELLFSKVTLSPPKNITLPFLSKLVAKYLVGKYKI